MVTRSFAGEDGVGKDALINSLRRSGTEQGSKMALEYTYIDPFGAEDDGPAEPPLCYDVRTPN